MSAQFRPKYARIWANFGPCRLSVPRLGQRRLDFDRLRSEFASSQPGFGKRWPASTDLGLNYAKTGLHSENVSRPRAGTRAHRRCASPGIPGGEGNIKTQRTMDTGSSKGRLQEARWPCSTPLLVTPLSRCWPLSTGLTHKTGPDAIVRMVRCDGAGSTGPNPPLVSDLQTHRARPKSAIDWMVF